MTEDVACNSSLAKVRTVLAAAAGSSFHEGFSKKKFLKAISAMAIEGVFDECLDIGSGPFLFEMLNHQDSKMQIVGCLLLAKQAKLAVPESNIKDIIPVVTKLLNVEALSWGISVKEVAVLAVKRIVKRGANFRLMLGRVGAIPNLLALASQHGEDKLQILALQVLKELVLSENCNQERFTQAGGVQVVLDLVNSSCPKIRCLAAEIVGIIARLSNVRRGIASHTGVSSLIEAARTGSMASRARAAHALGLLAFVKRARRLIADAGGIPVLIDLLRDGDEVAKLVAGNSLGIISACVDHLWQVAQAGAIPLYIDLLEGGNPHGKDVAEDAFCILAASEENALSIIEHLVRILCYGSVESKAAAADIIWDLSSYRHSTSFLIAAGAIPLLVGLLKDDNEELRQNVSGAIAQLTYNDDDRQALAEAGVIPVLVELLQDTSTEVKGNAAEALNSFAEDPTYRDEIQTASAAHGLLIIQHMIRDDCD
ncbi:hypothetical protein KP509_08G046500 [Ceratopteris richardii]|nr:hypothetical protein KP509_08G046500 [Ceratopteris richardii]